MGGCRSVLDAGTPVRGDSAFHRTADQQRRSRADVSDRPGRRATAGRGSNAVRDGRDDRGLGRLHESDWLSDQPDDLRPWGLPVSGLRARRCAIVRDRRPGHPYGHSVFLALLNSGHNGPPLSASGFLAPMLDDQTLSHLDRLEAESIHILREVAAEFQNPVMTYSVGKDSSVLLHLLVKAFYPARPPIPLLHVDTGWKFGEMIAFRDRRAQETGVELRTHTNPDGVAQGIDRKSVVSGKSVSVRVDLGGRRIIKKKKKDNTSSNQSIKT